ncbi:SpoIIE family protein phosphatase [Streptomyces sp. NPDC051572]|uniref:ATP-binding SpoIIE family protein phosphatase n=1 Tax=unclassified Streptomyces TaxID=2593676 RepID=UPI00345048D6
MAVATVNAAGVITGWAPGASRLLGYSEEEATGRGAVDLIAADLPRSALRSIERQDEWCGGVQLLHRDGHMVEVRLRAYPMGAKVRNAGWVLTAMEADAPANDMTADLRTWAIDQMPIVFGIYDHEKRLVTSSEAGQRSVAGRTEPLVGLRPEEIYPGDVAEEFQQLMGQVLRTGIPLTMETFAQVPGEKHAHAWWASIYPLKDSGGRVHGVSVAAIDTSAQHQARQRLITVNAASARIGSTLDVVRTAQELADVATEQFADLVTVDLLDQVLQENNADLKRTTGTVVLSRAAQQSVLDGHPESAVVPGTWDRQAEDSPMACALATDRSARYSVDDRVMRAWLEQDTVRAQIVREYGMHSFIVVPLLARGTVLGLATFVRHRTPQPYDADDLLLAEEITARAAMAIDNALRYTHERDTAVALQRSMLPQRTPLEAAAAVEVAFRYLPAGSHAGVGGDWFDVIPLSGARVALVVGDVVGHGLQASATMGRLRTAVRTLADVDVPPDELLTHLDDLVLRLDREEGPGSEHFERPETGDIGATCLYAVYDPVSHKCTLARAGHPAPAIVRPDGMVLFPDVPAGPPLGLGGLPFESTEVELPNGSLIALFTDGLVESRDSDIDLGLERLSEALADSARPLEQICEDVLSSVLLDVPTDDVALLIARTRSLDAAQVATWDIAQDPATVAQARKLASDQLVTWGLEELSFVTELVVSELVTNAIRYAKPPIELRLIHDTSLISEVSDASNTSPHLRRARVFDEGGRGLLLVAQFAQRWGTRHTPDGKTIWAEQTLPADS